jgi:predicted DNA-binding transcriptional regulator AlpA
METSAPQIDANAAGSTATPSDSNKLAVDAKSAAAFCNLSRAQWWKLNSAGKVPKPIYLGSKSPRWVVEELRAWLAAGAPDRQRWQQMRNGVW